MKTNRLPLSPCLNCGYLLDRAIHTTGDDIPTPGDVTLCIKCSHIMIFTESMGFRNPTEAELDSIVQDDDVIKALVALSRMRSDEDDDEADVSRRSATNRLGRSQ